MFHVVVAATSRRESYNLFLFSFMKAIGEFDFYSWSHMKTLNNERSLRPAFIQTFTSDYEPQRLDLQTLNYFLLWQMNSTARLYNIFSQKATNGSFSFHYAFNMRVKTVLCAAFSVNWWQALQIFIFLACSHTQRHVTFCLQPSLWYVWCYISIGTQFELSVEESFHISSKTGSLQCVLYNLTTKLLFCSQGSQLKLRVILGHKFFYLWSLLILKVNKQMGHHLFLNRIQQ